MPFHNNVYYPYPSETPGTHSSAGIPSLLSSPLSQPSSIGHPAPPLGMMPSSGSHTTLPQFKFRPRRERLDWRRISALDVDLVISELDVDTLQEHIGTVTFCSLEGEHCQRCRSPVDPALVKLFRLAQLMVEWLLHCQSFLTLNLSTAEERLVAAGREREQLVAQQKELEEKVKALTTELKQRKKFIRTQQSLLALRIIGNHKCIHCEKVFISSSFLQNHMQRRHPDELESQLQSDSEKKSQMESLKVEISSLKQQVVQQQQALLDKTAQEKEQQSMHKEMLRELDHFKAEEMARMDRKIEDSRDGMRRELEYLYSRNLQARIEADQSQAVRHDAAASPVQRQAERDLDNYREMQEQAIQKLEHQFKKQDKKWKSRMHEIKDQHDSEKDQLMNELSKMWSLMLEQQEHGQKLREEMENIIITQREQIKTISSNPPTKVIEVPVVVAAPVPEPKPKRTVLEEPSSTPKLDPIQELSEEDRDSSSISERKSADRKPEPTPEKKQKVTPSALRKNPNIKKELRPALEQALVEKLEDLGVKPDHSGVKSKDLGVIMAKVHSERDRIASETPDYWKYREELAQVLEQKLRGMRRGSDPALEPGAQTKSTIQVIQSRPRSSSLPSRATQVMSGPPVKHAITPQPAPRSRTGALPKTSTPNSKTTLYRSISRTPPFSSDEESEEDTDEKKEGPVRHFPKPKPYHANPVQTRVSRASPDLWRQAPTKCSATSNLHQSAGPASTVTEAMVTTIESEEDWSEVSELLEINPKQLSSYKVQNSSIPKRNFGTDKTVGEIAKKIEKQLAERVPKKPVGGVSILPRNKKDMVQDLVYTDLEENDWAVSSLKNGLCETPKPSMGSEPLKKSQDSPSTSIWGTSTSKGQMSGLTETGTGSTLKSSLVSLSDFSDSEDI